MREIDRRNNTWKETATMSQNHKNLKKKNEESNNRTKDATERSECGKREKKSNRKLCVCIDGAK